MKNLIYIKKVAVLSLTLVAAGFAVPASADTTTAGYYDQFGNFHVYQTYTPPSPYFTGGNVYYYGGSNTGYGSYNPYNPGGYNTYSRTASFGSQVRCAADEVYHPINNFCLPSRKFDAIKITGSNLDLSGAKSATTKTTSVSADDNYQASAVSTLFGSKKNTSVLEIANIVVTSGPKNIYDEKQETNCDVSVSWDTSIPAAGQVVYGTASQAKVESFSYAFSATEGNSLQKTHSVKLGCLENQTYYFRVIAFSSGADSQRVISDEQTIFPIKIRTQIPVVGSSSPKTTSTGSGASVLSTLGSILTHPITLIIIFGGIAYWVVMRILRKGKSEEHGGAHSAVVPTEPALQIPHH